MRGTLSVGPLQAARDFTLEGAAGRLESGQAVLELVQCSVPGCTLRRSRAGGHHHHDAVSRKPSPLACRCAHPSAR